MTAAEIIATVAKEAGLSPRDILGDSRLKLVTMARQEAMLRVRERTGKSFPQIGMIFNRDHSTVQHGCAAAAERRKRGITMHYAATKEIEGKIQKTAKDCVSLASRNLDQPSHIAAALISAASSASYLVGISEEDVVNLVKHLYARYGEVLEGSKNVN